MDKLKKTLYLGLVSLLCLSMIGCSSKNAFKVGDIEFSNQDVERVESILTATSNYTDANYLSDFKSSKDNKEITSKVIGSARFGVFKLYSKRSLYLVPSLFKIKSSI